MGRESTKQQLLDVAIDIINEKGEADLRVDELLTRVGVAAPSLYHHFGSREGLVVAAQVERFARVIRGDFQKFIDALRSSTSMEQLREAIRLAYLLRDDPARDAERFMRLSALGAAYARPELARRIVEVHDDFVNDIVAALEPFQRSGMIRKDLDLGAVIAWYNGAVIGKCLVEIAPTTLRADQWTAVMDDAVNHLLFG